MTITLSSLNGAGAELPPIDVFLIGGQSNAVGHTYVTDTVDSPSVPSGKVLQYHYDAGNYLIDANDPVGHSTHSANWDPSHASSPNGEIGSAWPAFGMSYYYATGRMICFVQKAVAGSSQVSANQTGTGTWDTNGSLFGASVTTLDQALAYLATRGYAPVFKGILWHQGETDAIGTTTNYQTRLTTMLSTYRSLYGTTMPFYIFQLGTYGPPTSYTDAYKVVRTAQETVAAADPYTKIVWRGGIDLYARGLMSDAYHYKQQALNEMGVTGASNVISSGANLIRLDNPVIPGAWTIVPFDANNFTAAAGTWTVTSGQVSCFAYTVINKLMTLSINIDGSTVAGGPTAELRIKIPGGFLPKRHMGCLVVCSNAGGAYEVGLLGADADISYIKVYRMSLANWTTSAVVGGQFQFEIE